MNVTIRQGVPEDAAAVSELALQAKSSVGYSQQWLDLWQDALTIRPDYLGAHRSVVAVRDTGLVGICVLASRGQDGSLDHVWIAPEVQGQGIGRTLVKRALELAASTDLRRVTVESDPSAKGFYLRLGARGLGERPAPMPGAPDRVLPLLEFAVDDPLLDVGAGNEKRAGLHPA